MDKDRIDLALKMAILKIIRFIFSKAYFGRLLIFLCYLAQSFSFGKIRKL